MPECLPFCGWRYNKEKVDIQKIVAPPYDVVNKKEKEEYKKKSPYNIFHLELPENYQRAKTLLSTWIKDKILIKDSEPALYLYELIFKYKNNILNRKGLILLVKLSPFDEGIILPHEKTFHKITQERLELLKITKFQFSQVFGLYEDPQLITLEIFKNDPQLLYEVNHNGEIHKFYKITDKETIKSFLDTLKDKKIYIADGHHRYITALKYKEYMNVLYGDDLKRDYHYIAMYITPMEDKNLLILPTHRVYYLKNIKRFVSDMEKYATPLKEFKEINLEKIELYFTNPSTQWIIFYQNKLILYELKSKYYKKFININSILSEIPLFNFLQILENILEVKEEELAQKGKVKFLSKIEKLENEVKKGALGVIFPALSPEVFKNIACKKELMPPKCTYFYPKILTGFVLNEVSGQILDF